MCKYWCEWVSLNLIFVFCFYAQRSYLILFDVYIAPSMHEELQRLATHVYCFVCNGCGCEIPGVAVTHSA